MFDESSRPLRRWMRYTASVPKGFLRYYVLRLLEEKPMSGSEIMQSIEEQTDGRWKPSPGSVYPLLSWLQDKGYSKEVSVEEEGIKRYMLSEKGKKFVEEQEKLKEKMQEKLEFLGPLALSGFLLGKPQELRDPIRRLARALFNFRRAMGEKIREEKLKEVAEILDNTASKIEEINRRPEAEKSSSRS